MLHAMLAGLPHHHDPVFVGLALIVAVLGSWTALDLFRRVRSHIGRARLAWLGLAAVAMGLSIWSMHFIAMLGFDPGSPVRYDVPLTLLSLALAVGATCGAFFSASRQGASDRAMLTAGLAMGVGICLMHYVGMAALRTAVSLGYRPSYVVASFVVAIVASTAALYAGRQERSIVWRAIAAVILGLAIVGMHYTAMAGLELGLRHGAAAPMPGAPPMVLGAGVAGGTLIILFLALLASLYDQRLNVLGALEAGGVGYWEFTLPDRRFHLSARGKEIFGQDPDAPFSHDDLLATLSPEHRAERDGIFANVLSGAGEYDAEYELQGPAAGRWVNVRGRVVSRRGGQPRRLAGIVLDVTDRREAFAAVAAAEERQRLLIDELNHRVKNTLATVQSIARQTAKQAPSVDAFREAFDARLVALSQTHNALTRGGWEHANLREILEHEFSPYAPSQVRLAGEDLDVSPRQALALGMVFHELATNAAKYGALSQPTGRVEVSWRADPADGALTLDWCERDGPAVRPATRKGFGSRLVEAAMRGELGGSADVAFPPEGFRCRLRLPLAA